LPEHRRRSSSTSDASSGATPVRSFWSGTITFGLVSIPVDLFAAVVPRQKSMKLVDEEGHPLGRRYWCPKHEKVLDDDELVRGYETDSGKVVVVTDAEFASVAPEKSRDIELKRFVALDDIPPFFFDRPYFLAPDERAGKAYALLAETMAKTGKAGIGSFVMRDHEYLVAIVAEQGMLRAEVLRYADELRTPEAIGLPKAEKGDAARVRAFAKEIDALAEAKVDRAELADLEADTLREAAQQKAKSGNGVVSMAELEGDEDDAAASAQVIDLMQVLRDSLGARAGTSAAAAAPDASAPARKSAAKKSAPKEPAAKKAAAKKTKRAAD
jgi:DNA end-binding protein Ku